MKILPQLNRYFLLTFLILGLTLPFILTSRVQAKSPKDTLVIAWSAAPLTIDPRFAADANSQYLEDLQNCSLINFAPDGLTVLGEVAESWRWKDAQTLEFVIKPDIYFSNGEKLTALDIQATYEFFKQTALKKPSPKAGIYQKIAKIVIKNPTTLEFTLKEADVSFLTNFSLGILPQSLATKEMLTKPEELVGCGAFTLKKIDVQGLFLEANKYYSLGPKPKMQHLEIKIVKDELTRFAKLQKGEIDLLQNGLSRDRLASIDKHHLRLLSAPGLNLTYLGFNCQDKYLSQTKVRQAIAMAINREALIKYILKDMAIPAKTVLTPNDVYLNPKLGALKFDPEAAKKLLDEAGLPLPAKGQPRFMLNYNTTQTHLSIAKAIANDLSKIGINVKVQVLEWGAFYAAVQRGEVQLWSLNWIGFKDPDIYRMLFSSTNFPPNGNNRGRYSNPELDRLLLQGIQKTNLKERQAVYYQVQELLQKEMPYVFLWHETTFAVLNKDLKGFVLYADGRMSALKYTYK